jgi:hypothetical protein
MNRKVVTQRKSDEAFTELHKALIKQVEAKGRHGFASIHEILGIVDEEHDELKEAVRFNNRERVMEELIDIAVGALWGIASMKEGTLDW